ncbi:hypothetical protein ABZY02_04065 [Streptomyces sp. NPDC006649]|uniref:hypothetical protein n=1 Tax=unclassified Streptomyces TaxID=2593676 RepID=UPI0033B50C14
MAIGHNQYESLMTRLREEIPGLADQLDEEVRHGRVVSAQDHLQEEGQYYERASRLAATKLPALGQGDIAVIPYTGEERLQLVREAVLTLAETMYATRKSVLDTVRERGMGSGIEFGDPELEVPSQLDLQAETAQAWAALQTVRELLADGQDTYSEALQ